MKFLVLGDVHAQLKLINKYVEQHPEVVGVLQAGDFGIWREQDFKMWGYIIDKHGHWDVTDSMVPFETVVKGDYHFDRPIYFISGNHENFDYRDSVAFGDLNYTSKVGSVPIPFIKFPANIYWVNNGVVEAGGVKIAGLNGCYSYKVYTGGYQKRKRLFTVKPQTPPHIEAYLNEVMGRDPRGRFTEKDIKGLKKHKADILLLHEIPFGLPIRGELPIKNPPGASPINELIEEMQPRYAFCGHFHVKLETTIGRTKVLVLPTAERGYGILDTDDWSFTWC
jgi:hypothetical protein